MRKKVRRPDESTDLVSVKEPVRPWTFAALTLQITDVLHATTAVTQDNGSEFEKRGH